MELRTTRRGGVDGCSDEHSVCSVALLAGFSVTAKGRMLTVPTRKAAALLAILSFHVGSEVRREALMAELWPDGFEESARTSLRQALAMVRRMFEAAGFEPGVILSDRQTIALSEASFRTDVQEFLTRLVAADETEGDRRLDYLTQATKAYTGPLLEGFDEPWIMAERLRLEGLFVAASVELAEALSDRGSHAQALRHAQRAAEADALSEAARIATVRALLGMARCSDARLQVRELERLLHHELGAEPSGSTKRTFEHLFETMGREVHASEPTHLARRTKTVRSLRLIAPFTVACLIGATLLRPPSVKPVADRQENQYPGAAGWPQPSGQEIEAQLSRLRADPESARGEAAAEWLSEEGWHAWYGRHEQLWLTTLSGADHDLTLALEWGLKNDPGGALKMAGALCHYWSSSGGYPRSRAVLLKRALRTRLGSPSDRARALCGLVDSYLVIGFDQSLKTAWRTVRLAEEAVVRYRRLGDRWGEAHALWYSGLARAFVHKPDQSLAYYDASTALFRKIRDPNGEGWVELCRGMLPWTIVKSGHPPGASLEGLMRSLDFFRTSGNTSGYDLALNTLTGERFFLTYDQRERLRSELLNIALERSARFDPAGESEARRKARSLNDPMPAREGRVVYIRNGSFTDSTTVVGDPDVAP